MSLESMHTKEKLRRQEAEKDLKEARQRLAHRNEVHGEVIGVHRQIEKMAGQIADQLIPQNELVINLKNHIAQLHQRLGATPAQAQFHTLVQAGEYEYLGDAVSAMMADGQQKLAVVPQMTGSTQNPNLVTSNQSQEKAAKQPSKLAIKANAAKEK